MLSKRYSIRTQVALLTLVPLLLLAIGLETFFLHDRFAALDAGLLERGKLVTQQLSVGSEFAVFVQNKPFLVSIAQGALMQQDVHGVVILDRASQPLAQAGKLSHPLRDVVAQANVVNPSYPLQTQLTLVTEELDAQGKRLPILSDQTRLWIYQPVVSAQFNLEEAVMNSREQIGAVIVEMDRTRTQTLKNKLLWFAILLTLLLLSAVLYAVYLASQRLTAPIRQLSLAINLFTAGKLDTRVAEDSPIIEINTLETGINSMAVQLLQERATLQQRVADATVALRNKKDEAECANQEKSRFLAIATHDLRQPLHALGLCIAELQRKVTREDLRHLVGQVENSVESLSVLLNALLDISKLDAGAVVPKIQTCDLSELLTRFSADYQLLARIKNIRVVVHCPPLYVITDPVLLARILMNLVSNAIRYTPVHGCVMIACRRRGDKLRIEVRDNGVGIAKQNLDNIFREFFQIVPTGLEAQKSLGLGLSIVQRLVKLLGHALLVHSAPNRGSVFTLIVPLTHAPRRSVWTNQMPSDEEHTETRQQSATPLAGKSFLVVEDDVLVLESTATLLESWGGKVTRATGMEMLLQQRAQGAQWDLLISDYQLAENETGLEVITTLRSQRQKNLPSILISGDTSAAVLQLANQEGLHLLHKPVQPAKLRSLVLFLLEPKSS